MLRPASIPAWLAAAVLAVNPLPSAGTAVERPALHATPEAPGDEAGNAALRETGRALSAAFLAGDTATVWRRFDPAMQGLMGLAALAAFRTRVSEQVGEELEVLGETVDRSDGLATYTRTSRWSRVGGSITMQWAIDEAGRVAGFVVRPAEVRAAASRHDGRPTRAALRLPFDGPWHVYWGGRSLDQNYHASDRGQRFAYDFVRRVDGRSHGGDGTRLESYHCWDAPILAPGSARVVATVDVLPDQAIGTTNTMAPAGNHVVLELGHGEFAFLAHLRQGSVVVAPGDTVERGQLLGRCGNSGNTSQPHLHVHLQDSPRFGDGDGLPMQFVGYLADDRPVARGEPLRGQSVRQP